MIALVAPLSSYGLTSIWYSSDSFRFHCFAGCSIGDFFLRYLWCPSGLRPYINCKSIFLIFPFVLFFLFFESGIFFEWDSDKKSVPFIFGEARREIISSSNTSHYPPKMIQSEFRCWIIKTTRAIHFIMQTIIKNVASKKLHCFDRLMAFNERWWITHEINSTSGPILRKRNLTAKCELSTTKALRTINNC